MKKAIVSVLIIFMILSISTVFAIESVNTLEKETTSEVLEMTEKVHTGAEAYTKKYGSETYGMAAYILHLARIYSIPICFVGIIIGALYQYVLGTRRLDMKHKGYGIIMTFVTLLVICQIIPLIFTVVVIGWRG